MAKTTDDRLPWFRCFPTKLLGAFAGMLPDEAYVYWIVCLRIYETGRECPDDAAALARRTGYGRKHIDKIVTSLVDNGKLTGALGALGNDFALAEMADREKKFRRRQKNSSTASKKRWQKSKENQRNGDASRIPLAMPNDAHLHLHLDSDSKNLNLKGAKEKNGKYKGPPRHGAISKSRGTIWLKYGSEDFETYAVDYKAANKIDPAVDRHGGFWFNISGEERAMK